MKGICASSWTITKNYCMMQVNKTLNSIYMLRNFYLLKSDKINGYFTSRLTYIYDIISCIHLRMKNVSDKNCRDNHNTHFVFNNFFPIIMPFVKKWGRIQQSRAGYRWQYSTWTLHSGFLRLQAQTQNMYYLFLFHFNNGCKNAL